jgi:DNA topoisomerase I
MIVSCATLPMPASSHGAADVLRFTDDRMPGYSRCRRGRGWMYFDAAGNRITDRDEIDRLNAVGLPPAYRRAWFCPDPLGHIQAVGYDDKGRKQYRYHPDFRAQQEADKFDRCADFGRGLPRLRARVDRDLRRRRMDWHKAVAAVVRLLDASGIRVGNEYYARVNRSFGATTLRNRHAEISGSTVRLRFPGKSRRTHDIGINDPVLARVVRRCQDLPGQHLFGYTCEDREVRPVTSTDVNSYIREAMGSDFTAKHFRTWTASVVAFEALTTQEGGIRLKEMLEQVADTLGNTPAIARKSYVHPALIDIARKRRSLAAPRLRPTRYLSSSERGLIAFLDGEAERCGGGAVAFATAISIQENSHGASRAHDPRRRSSRRGKEARAQA